MATPNWRWLGSLALPIDSVEIPPVTLIQWAAGFVTLACGSVVVVEQIAAVRYVAATHI